MDIGKVKGVGEVRKKLYARLGIETVEDLIEYLPKRYENRGDILPLSLAPDGMKHSCVVTVATEPRAARIGGGRHLVKFRVYDESASCEIAYFCRNVHAIPRFTLGETYRMYGKYELVRGRLECANPIADKFDGKRELPSFFPIYKVTEGLSSKIISSGMEFAFSLSLSENGCSLYEEYMPNHLLEKRNISPLYDMYHDLHLPKSRESIEKAQYSAAYREFFTFFCMNIFAREERLRVHKEPLGVETPADFVRNLPFELTPGQIEALKQIKADLNSDKLMRRLIIGDVGCGKTVVAEIAALMVANKGSLVALMAPTEILANQHFLEMSEIFERYGMRAELLLGSTPASVRKRIIRGLSPDALPEEKIHLIIGTHALLNEKIEFPNLGLVLIDEQHRFGVAQRQKLIDKGKNVNSLSFSATPIPRSYAKMLYGDVDASLITDLPPNRKVPRTQVGRPDQMPLLDDFIQKRVLLGEQVYVVCPMIDLPEDATKEERERAEHLSVEAEHKRLCDRYPFYNIDILHGKMSAEAKREAMRKFAAYETHVLVSTTVIEVGVNVPNATVMIVIGADHFGLAQLHQLRGRISRGSKPSYCYLVSSTDNKESMDRLRILCEHSSGFDIAEADFKLRGPGDLISMTKTGNIRQSGEFAFKYSDFCKDDSIMNAAHADAEEFLSTADGRSYPPLRKKLQEVMSRSLSE